MPNPVKNRGHLNVRYCAAFGIDAERYAGFRLTVLTSHLPVLEAFDMTTSAPDGGWAVDRYVLVPTSDGPEVDPKQITIDFCEAFGVDTRRHAGFRFTVLGGELPALEAFVLPPTVADGRLSDEHAEALERLLGRFHPEAPDSVVALEAADTLDVEPVPHTVSEPVPEFHASAVAGPEAPATPR
jgi:hypothetical protein